MNVAERMGFPPDAKLLMINADDFGLCHATNLGIMRLLEEGAVTSATVMMPCNWAREAVRWSAERPQFSVGVHFTLTSEWEPLAWGPVRRNGDVSSLATAEGVFPPDVATVERKADPKQVRLELIAQIETAKEMGLDPSHIDSHMGAIYGLATGRHFMEEVFEVCMVYGLPLRVPRNLPENRGLPPEMERMARYMAQLADESGVLIVDNLILPSFQKQLNEAYDTCKANMIKLLRNLKPGLNELVLHPSLVTEELKAIHPHWEKRGWEMDIVRDPDVKKTIEENEIRLVRWMDVRSLQRGER